LKACLTCVANSAVFLQDVVIQTEDEIRVKIVGTRVDATDIVSTK